MPDFGMKMIEDYLPRHWMSDQKQKYTERFDEIVDKYVPKAVDVDYYIGICCFAGEATEELFAMR